MKQKSPVNRFVLLRPGVDHVLQHAQDRPGRSSTRGHGVFADDPFAITEQAWAKAGERAKTNAYRDAGEVYVVPMDDVGLVGGIDGAAAGNPLASHVRIVIESTATLPQVISVYPVLVP